MKMSTAQTVLVVSVITLVVGGMIGLGIYELVFVLNH